eukprot:Em0014g85a
MAGYKLVSKDHIRLDDTRYRHAAHAMVYAPVREKMLGKYEYKYAVMMQCRFDGTLGFPGGIVDSGETPEASVTREFVEEVGVAVGDVVFEEKDHIVTHVSDHTHFCLHFFAREVDLDMFVAMERKALLSKDWGQEVMGIVRCPLYTLPNGLGLPAFLKHDFIGNSRDQLLIGIERRGLLSPAELKEAPTLINWNNAVTDGAFLGVLLPMPGPVTRLTWTSGQNYVYAITSTSVVQVLIEQCSSFTGCLSCAANVNSLSGWRTVEQKCSRSSGLPSPLTGESFLCLLSTGNGVPISAPSSQVNQTTGAMNTPKLVVNIGFGSSLLNIPFATSRLTTYNCAAATSAGSSARVPPSKLEQKNIKLEQRNRELNAIIQEMRQEMEQCVNADPAGIADGQLMVKDVLSRVSDAPYSAEYVCYLERELAEMKAEKRKIAKRLDELVAH